MDDDELLVRCLDKTRRYSTNWFELGLLLKVKMHILDEIKEDNPRKVGTCRREMLYKWLKSLDKTISPLDKLDAALKELQKTTCNSVKENHNAECLSLNDDVQVKILELKREFRGISMKAREHLKANHSDAEEAAWWLNETLGGTLNEPPVIRGSVSDYGKLGEQLQSKWRFANPDFLEQLVQEIQDTELIEQMKAYRRKFEQFCSSFPISKGTTYDEVFFEDHDPSQPCLVLIIEWDTNFRAVEVFLEDVFGIYKHYLRVHKIRSGEIKKVTLQFPPSMGPHLEERIKRNVNNYADIQVEQAENPQTGGSQEKVQADTDTSITKTGAQLTLQNHTKRDLKLVLHKICIPLHKKEMQPHQIQRSGKKATKKYQKQIETTRKFEMSRERKENPRIRLHKFAQTSGATGEDPEAQKWGNNLRKRVCKDTPKAGTHLIKKTKTL